jgi:hypothetical protein
MMDDGLMDNHLRVFICGYWSSKVTDVVAVAVAVYVAVAVVAVMVSVSISVVFCF